MLVNEVSTSFRISYDASRQQVRVSWHFVLDTRATERPLHVDGVSVYGLDVRGMVRKHVVEIIIVNGTAVKPPFAHAWLDLPAWLAEGLKGAAAAPGLSSSIAGGGGGKIAPSSVVDVGWQTYGNLAQKAFFLEEPAARLLRPTTTTRARAGERVGNSDLYVNRATTEGVGQEEVTTQDTSNGVGGGSDASSDEAQKGAAAGVQKTNAKDSRTEKQDKDKKKSWWPWPIVESPWACETSWDCHGGQVCCDLILVKVCCTNGVMQPKPGAVIPVYVPIPGRGRTELDQ